MNFKHTHILYLVQTICGTNIYEGEFYCERIPFNWTCLDKLEAGQKNTKMRSETLQALKYPDMQNPKKKNERLWVDFDWMTHVEYQQIFTIFVFISSLRVPSLLYIKFVLFAKMSLYVSFDTGAAKTHTDFITKTVHRCDKSTHFPHSVFFF